MSQGPLVAIVDDDDSIRDATDNLLTAAGYSTTTFSSAESFMSSDATENLLEVAGYSTTTFASA